MKKEKKESPYNIVAIHTKCANQRHNKWQKENPNLKVMIGDYCKIKFEDGDSSEHMWVKITKLRYPNKFTGTLDNVPVLVKNVTCDTVVLFTYQDIEQHLPKNFDT